MSDRNYRTILGFLILVSLYFETAIGIYSLVVVLLLEGITNCRITKIVGKIRQKLSSGRYPGYVPDFIKPNARFAVESERMWRLVVGCMLGVSFYFYDILWFVPWFMGFTIFGAGLSGVCPVLMAIRWVGFK